MDSWFLVFFKFSELLIQYANQFMSLSFEIDVRLMSFSSKELLIVIQAN